MERQKITVVGIGYVGLGVGVMLASKHDVTMLDIDKEKVGMINSGKSPIKERMIQEALASGRLSITATDSADAYDGADFIIIAVPTDYNEETGRFNTDIVESVVRAAVERNPEACIVIKSTIPVGYTKGLIDRLKTAGIDNPKVIFSPEFLREGTALFDNLYPNRVIAGCEKGLEEYGRKYLKLIDTVTEGDYPELVMGPTEAEAVKLFANTYLAMRVAYFNELDTYAERNGLNAGDIIEGMCYDSRIGNQYNNPSFGYGGYCFPKDTKQLLANFNGVPQNLIGAIVESNETRKNYIVDSVIKKLSEKHHVKAVGIYKLAMKSGSDNSRKSAILDIIKGLENRLHNTVIYVYDPSIGKLADDGIVLYEEDFEKFKEECDIILTNRYDVKLDDVKGKVYTRDIFHNN